VPLPPGLPMASSLRQERKSTQRERLLAAMTCLVAQEGYAAATIAQVISHAGVSRPTFYDYFTDKADCFVATLAAIQERLTADVGQAVRGQAPEHAPHVLVGALVGFAHSRPTSARVLLGEAMSGGPRALDVRDHGIAELEQLLEGQYRALDPATAVPDLSARVLVGAIYRLLAARLRFGDRGMTGLVGELHRWITAYERPIGEHCWRALRSVPSLVPPLVVATPLLAPRPLPPGRARLSKEEVAENHRERILLAAARLAEDKGYTATTVLDISKLARLDARAFYRLYDDKQAAFDALHELLFRHIIASTAAGFAAGQTWPERIWRAGLAFTHYIEQNQTLAHAAFVESYAGGPASVKRVNELVNGFTVFLEEGYRYASASPAPSPLALEAIAAAVFELDYGQARERRVRHLSGLVPQVTFIALAPFVGSAQANAFIADQLKLT
jgi:AcrR family transcriptional regulator